MSDCQHSFARTTSDQWRITCPDLVQVCRELVGPDTGAYAAKLRAAAPTLEDLSSIDHSGHYTFQLGGIHSRHLVTRRVHFNEESSLALPAVICSWHHFVSCDGPDSLSTK